ncbi:MAG: polysaccharide deacetylase family protein [Firmicutes bacterium]|nr:polysaccharide deacetylase family protein [Bacillota bacterium]
MPFYVVSLRSVRRHWALMAAGILTVAALGWGGAQVLQPGNLARTGMVDRFPGADRWVVLAFADGPNARTTPVILRELKADHVTATFFPIGLNLLRDSRETSLLVQGHEDVECHTLGHINLASHSYRADLRDLQADVAIVEAVGHYRPHWLYPPYGAVSSQSRRAAMLLHLTIVLPTPGEGVSPRVRRPGAIIHQVLSHLQPGAIIILPDRVDDWGVVQALPRLLHLIQVEGYRVTSLSRVGRPGGP